VKAAGEICQRTVHITTAERVERSRRILRGGVQGEDVRSLVASLEGGGDVLRLIGILILPI
jgi:hypothetical protein